MDTYEKKYKEALERAMVWKEKSGMPKDKQGILDDIFPELAESEDERIRKELIEHCRNTRCVTEEGAERIVKWIAWLEKQGESYTKKDVDDAYVEGIAFAKNELEKQGEQKSTDKVEQKFKNGQWIVWQDKCYKVNYNGCGYELVDQNGLSTSLEYGTIDENAHLWDITKDAKDGDVLASELCDSIILFKGIKDNNIDFYCDYDFSKIDIPGDRFAVNNGQHYGSVEDSKDFHPATKEQRDLLFSKMKEAGYELDAEKKELEIVDWSKHIKYNPNAPSIIKEKPVWGEEDEKMCQETIDWFEKKCFPYALENDNPARESIKWLKSLKQGIGGKQ